MTVFQCFLTLYVPQCSDDKCLTIGILLDPLMGLCWLLLSSKLWIPFTRYSNSFLHVYQCRDSAGICVQLKFDSIIPAKTLSPITYTM